MSQRWSGKWGAVHAVPAVSLTADPTALVFTEQNDESIGLPGSVPHESAMLADAWCVYAAITGLGDEPSWESSHTAGAWRQELVTLITAALLARS